MPVDALVQTAAGISQFCFAVSLGFGTLVYMQLNTQYLRPYFDFIDFPQSMYKGTIPVEKRDDGEYEIAFCLLYTSGQMSSTSYPISVRRFFT